MRFGKNVHAFDVQNFVTRGLSIGIAICQGCMFSVRGSLRVTHFLISALFASHGGGAMEKTCCFFGHRKIEITEELKNRLLAIIENLIISENVTTFLFGSRSQFDDLCHTIVTELKEKYPHLRRNIPLGRRGIYCCPYRHGNAGSCGNGRQSPSDGNGFGMSV